MNKIYFVIALLLSFVAFSNANSANAQEVGGYASQIAEDLAIRNFKVTDQGHEGDSYVIRMKTSNVRDEDLTIVAINGVLNTRGNFERVEPWTRYDRARKSSYKIGKSLLHITVLQLGDDADGFSQGCLVKIVEMNGHKFMKPKKPIKSPKHKRKPPKKKKYHHTAPY